MHTEAQREAFFATLSLYTGKSIRVLKFHAFMRNIFKGF